MTGIRTHFTLALCPDTMPSRRRRSAGSAPARALLALVITVSSTGWAAGLTTGDFQGKNVVLFLTDQERATQHFPAGWEAANLPGLQRLKAHGVTFERAYTNTVTCSSARASLLTGLMPAQHGVRYKLRTSMPATNYPQEELPTDIENLATVAAAAGYNVVYKGKVDVMKPAAEDGVSAPSDAAKYGFQRWNPPDSGLGTGVGEFGGGTAPGAANDERYMSSRAADQSEVDAGLEGALQYVAEVAPLQQPFFLVVSLVNPHDVTFYPNQIFYSVGYNDSWLQGSIGPPGTLNEPLVPTKPSAQSEFVTLSNNGLLGPMNTTELQNNYVNLYGNLIKTVDGYLVQLLDALAPLINDTVVIKTSDHGEVGLAHGTTRQKCYNFYEEAARVPLVFSNPRLFPRPRATRALVSHIDLLPTLAALWGTPGAARFEGRSYAPVLLNKSATVQDYIIFTFEDYQIGQPSPPYVQEPNHIVCLREERWKFCRYYDPSAAVTKVRSQFEMYDLYNDPNEVINLVASPYHVQTAIQKAQYKRLYKKLTEVQKTRLAPRRWDHPVSLQITLTATAAPSDRGVVDKVGAAGGIPIGSGDVTLSSVASSFGTGSIGTKFTISSGSGIIRGTAVTTPAGKGLASFTSGSGAYETIRAQRLSYREQDGVITITGIATY